MNKEDMTRWRERMEECFFLQYHLGWRYDAITRLSETERKQLIELYIKGKQ